MQLFHSVHTLAPASWINCKCHMLQFCLTSLFLRTFAKSHFPVSSKQRQRYSVAAKQCLMEQPKKQLWVRQTLRLAVHHFSPLQCECIIVWAVAVRNDNRGWHWKVPKFSSLKSHWAGSDRMPQRKRGGVFDKTTTLKCSRSLRQTQKKCTYCFPALSLTHSVLSVSLNLSSKTEEIYNVHTIHFWVCMPFIHPNNLYIHFYFYLLMGLYSYEAYLWMNASKFYIAHHS